MTVSVLLTACNQGDWVSKTVDQAKTSLQGMDHEIIVVDDQSIDKCCHNLPTDVLVMRTQYRLGVSASRRLAADAATGDVLLFSDPHCLFPGDSLKQLAETARQNWAVVQPPTNRKRKSRKIAWGGLLYRGDRGLVNGSAPRGYRGVSLINTIYCVRTNVYRSFGGWPHLTGCWGYSEQAMSLTCWFAGVPMMVANTAVCTHLNAHVKRRLPFRVSTVERAINGHMVHAVFFPKTYQSEWRPALLARFGYEKEVDEALQSSHVKKFARRIRLQSVRTEEQFYTHMMRPDHRTESFLEQQRDRSKAMGTKVAKARLRNTLQWFVGVIPGCVKGRAVLDVGARDGRSLQVLARMAARTVEGVELLPEVAEAARDRGANVICADMRKLPYRDGQWNVVTCLHSLEHVPDPANALRELSRVLMPNGWMLLVVPRETTPVGEYAHNCCFPDSAALKELVRKEPSLDESTIRVKIPSYAKGKLEIRLAVRKRK